MEKEEISIDDWNSTSVTVAIEEKSLKEAEAEDKKQIESSDLDSEKKVLPAIFIYIYT